jgi:methionyl-tRNA formyltransferase
MFVAVLSPYPEEIAHSIEATGDSWNTFESIENVTEADFVISYGHRRLIGSPQVSRFENRILNLHISYLPWNRGADPNFWSFFDDTPKGVTIHLIDAGMDTGPILTQREARLSGTLATSYQQLRVAMQEHFREVWIDIRHGKIQPRSQERASGSHHVRADKESIWSQLPLGYATPVEEVEALGRRIRSSQTSCKSHHYKTDVG